MANAHRFDTEVVIVLDDDDPQHLNIAAIDPKCSWLPRIQRIDGPREDTLGAKYNRGYANAPRAKLYVPFVDTVAIVTPGWDERLYRAAKQFKDKIGAVNFGYQQNPTTLPQMIGLTPGFIKHQGYFMPPYFSFWWHDTWVNEISFLVRRTAYVDAKIGRLPEDKKTRGAREIAFWSACYYELRHERMEIARKIVAASDYPEWQKHTINLEMEYWSDVSNSREAGTTRNPYWIAEFQEKHSFDAEDNPRYQRVKAAMLEKIKALGPDKKAA
jgi:hypothetical protein